MCMDAKQGSTPTGGKEMYSGSSGGAGIGRGANNFRSAVGGSGESAGGTSSGQGSSGQVPSDTGSAEYTTSEPLPKSSPSPYMGRTDAKMADAVPVAVVPALVAPVRRGKMESNNVTLNRPDMAQDYKETPEDKKLMDFRRRQAVNKYSRNLSSDIMSGKYDSFINDDGYIFKPDGTKMTMSGD